jgi:hypothetical protein
MPCAHKLGPQSAPYWFTRTFNQHLEPTVGPPPSPLSPQSSGFPPQTSAFDPMHTLLPCSQTKKSNCSQGSKALSRAERNRQGTVSLCAQRLRRRATGLDTANDRSVHPPEREAPSTAFEAIRVCGLPAPRVFTHRLQVALGSPAEQLFGIRGIGITGGDIAGSARL